MALLTKLGLAPTAAMDAARAAELDALKADLERRFAATVANARSLPDPAAKARLAAALTKVDSNRRRADSIADSPARAKAYRALLGELDTLQPARSAGDRAAGPKVATTASPASPPPQPRAAAPQPRAAPPATTRPSIRDWLEQHQFAPPRKQPETGEKHVLLNGEEITRSKAIALAVEALKETTEDVGKVIDALLDPPGTRSPGTLADLPQVGPGNTVPGLNIAPGKGGLNPELMKIGELARIDEWLDEHHFYKPAVPDPSGNKVMFDGKETTIDALADKALAVVGSGGEIKMAFVKRPEVVARLRQRYVDAPMGPLTQVVLNYQLVPLPVQATTDTSSKKTLHQFGFTITRADHASDKGGGEYSLQGVVTIDQDGKLVNLQGVAQAARVKPLLDGWMQVSGFVQAGISANWMRGVSGTAVCPGVSAGVGAQALVTLPWPSKVFGGKAMLNGFQIGVQVTAGVQGVHDGSGVVGDAAVTGGAVLNIPFNLPGEKASK